MGAVESGGKAIGTGAIAADADATVRERHTTRTELHDAAADSAATTSLCNSTASQTLAWPRERFARSPLTSMAL